MTVPTTMIPLARAPDADLAKVGAVFLDIDDTLSTRGKLTAEAYAALSALRDAGLWVVPVTGRPAGWCDLIARFWPVDAVVGENGAFTFFLDPSGVRRRLDTPGAPPAEERARKLAALGEAIRARFPHARWASDQAYREYDLAIDFCEDVPRWPDADVQALLALCAAAGAHAKLSSIHVNAWFGEYDKATGVDHWFAQGCPGVAPTRARVRREDCLFVGDSPNDSPLFRAFALSVGVANLKAFGERVPHPPRYVTEGESGTGFAELAARLLAARHSAMRVP